MKREDNISNIMFTIYCEYPNPFKPGTTAQEIVHRGTEEMALNEKYHPDAIHLYYTYSYKRHGKVTFI
mgnify:FL=1